MSHYQPPSRFQRFLYVLSQVVCRFLFRVVGRVRIEGRENIPMEGGVLIAANHISNIDPPLVGAFCPRMIYFFAKEELFGLPVLGWWIAQINAFPVKRYEHDVGAFKRAQTLLEHGQGVLLFPEGRRSRDGLMGKAKPGVAMLAYRTEVPVVPALMENTDKFGSFARLRLVFGKPIRPPAVEDEKRAYQAFSDEVLQAVANLRGNKV